MSPIRTLHRISLLVLLPACGFLMACSPSTAATATPVLLGVEYHPGETVRYTFSLRMNLTTRVEPSVSSDALLRFTLRKYTVEGGIVATFALARPVPP